MSDFLGRLAARSLDQMPRVETRRQPSFAAAAGPAAPLEIAWETAAIPPASVPHGRVTAPADPEQRRVTRGETQPAAATEDHEEAASPIRTPHAAHAGQDKAPESPQPLVQTYAAIPHAPLRPSGAPEPHADAQPALAAARPSSHATDAPLAQPATRAWAPLVPGHRPQPRAAEPAPMTNTRSAAEPAAPAIHISIGRVEVRANLSAAPAAARPRPAPQPTLTLDDYLKRGGGGS